MPPRFFRYVLHGEAADFEAAGWMIVAWLGDYSVLAAWLCECPMPNPRMAHNEKGPPEGGP